jgi:hypothetical protein
VVVKFLRTFPYDLVAFAADHERAEESGAFAEDIHQESDEGLGHFLGRRVLPAFRRQRVVGRCARFLAKPFVDGLEQTVFVFEASVKAADRGAGAFDDRGDRRVVESFFGEKGLASVEHAHQDGPRPCLERRAHPFEYGCGGLFLDYGHLAAIQDRNRNSGSDNTRALASVKGFVGAPS